MSEPLAAWLRRVGVAVAARLPRSWIGDRVAVVVAGRVWLSRGVDGIGPSRLETRWPEAFADWVAIRLARQHARRRWRWQLLWLVSRRFRWEEEKAAWTAWLQRWGRDGGGTLSPALRRALLRRLRRHAPSPPAAAAFLDAALAQRRQRRREELAEPRDRQVDTG